MAEAGAPILFYFSLGSLSRSTSSCRHTQTGEERGWQYIFPAPESSTEPDWKGGSSAKLAKSATVDTLRRSFAAHLLMSGYDIRISQELLGHQSVTATMINTHVLSRGREGS